MLIVEAFILLLYDKHASRKSIFLGDIFRPDYFHVLPALIRRFREVKESGAKVCPVGERDHRGANFCMWMIREWPASFL